MAGGHLVAEQLHRGPELLVAVVAAPLELGQVVRDAPAAQLAVDAGRAPAVDRALVLGEQAGEALVVQRAGVLQLAERVLDVRLVDLLALEEAAYLGDGPLAPGDGPVGERDRPVLGAVAQAACSSMTSPVSGSTPGGGPPMGSTSACSGSMAA